MYAIEFHTAIKNGVIEIPPEHVAKLQGEVTVIVVPSDRDAPASDLIGRLLAAPRHATGFKPLTREESHVR